METDNIAQTKTGPKDVFMHLLAIIALYASAGSFIALVFQYINILIPDVLQYGDYYGRVAANRAVRWSIAALVVVFPVYVFTNWYLNKDCSRTPEKRDFRLRKWLIYFTLFASALIIIGDLVTLIYNLLGGELTTRFLLKILTVFFTAGSVFYYYLWDLRRHHAE